MNKLVTSFAIKLLTILIALPPRIHLLLREFLDIVTSTAMKPILKMTVTVPFAVEYDLRGSFYVAQ